MQFKVNIEKQEFYNNYYKALNYILNLTPKELVLLSNLSFQKASLPKDLSDSEKDYIVFSASNRRETAKSLGISIFNFNNHIKNFKDKNFILDIREKGKKKRLSLHPKIYIDVDSLIDNKINIEYILNLI